MTFDVTQFEMEDTAVLAVKNIRGDDDLLVNGEPVTIELYSAGSKQGVKALHKAGRAAQMRLTRTIRGEFDSKDAEKVDQERIEKLVGFTKAVNNFPIEGGAEAIYSNPKLGYITRQVDEFIAKDANFSKPSAAN